MNIFRMFKWLLLEQFMFYGGGKGGSAPDAPDPYTVAGATTATNDATAAYNKALNLNNYSNPFGSQSSQITGVDPSTGAPIYSSNTTANPQLQGMLNSLIGQAGQSGSINQGAQNGYNAAASSYLGLNNALGNLSMQTGNLGSQLNMGQANQAQQQGQDAAYQSQTQYLDPQFSQQGESLNASLANQGLTPGSQAYNNAQLNQSNAKQQAYSNAANQAILTGTQVGAQDLQNQISGINTQSGLLNQQAGMLGQQGTNLGAYSGLLGQQVNLAQMPYSNLQSIAGLVPGYAGPAQSSSSPANIGQNVYSNYQSQLNNYNAQQQSANQTTSGLFGLGSAAILGSMMTSDRRVKRDVKRLGVLDNGLPWYEFGYIWDRITDPKRQGVMADEVRKVKPGAVYVHVAGFDMVDYQQLAEV